VLLSPAGASRTKGFLENEARVLLFLTFFYFGGSVKRGAIVHWNVGLISILVKSDENPKQVHLLVLNSKQTWDEFS